MSNGGYIMIDFGGLSLSTSEPQTIEGIYSDIEKALQTKKPVIAYNLTFNNIPVYYRNVNIVKSSDNIILTSDIIQITVSANDAVTVSSNAGVTDYEDLDNLPKINSVEIKGNVSLATLGIASTADIEPLQPVDSVTNGETKPVSSNAVYDYLNRTLTITKEANETYGDMLNRLFAAIDFDKVTPKTTLVIGTHVYNITTWSSVEMRFLRARLGIDTTYTILENLTVKSSGSGYASSSTSEDYPYNHTDNTSDSAPTAITIYY